MTEKKMWSSICRFGLLIYASREMLKITGKPYMEYILKKIQNSSTLQKNLYRNMALNKEKWNYIKK